MSHMRYWDLMKLSFKIMGFKFEQSRLATGVHEVVETSKGSVRGVHRRTVWGDTYASFEKIPYAKPPLGELRFRAPQPAEPWTGVLDCSSGPAEAPMQTNMIFRKYKGSEDCLYLNVYTKTLSPAKPLPVMVWIYGGGFQVGEASRDMYSPDFFMTKDVVLVTVAYRLGPFGFLSIDDPAVDVPGNAGLKDQILSLRWVRDNIARFGGDPDNVTVFGESAGGSSTHLCMLSEQSRGLFHKAIVMSGSALCPWTRPPKNQWALRLAQALGYKGKATGDATDDAKGDAKIDSTSDVKSDSKSEANGDATGNAKGDATGDISGADIYKFLLKVPAPDLVKAATTLLSKDEKHHRILFAFGPTLEPYVTEHCVMSEDPHTMMQHTWSNRIPLMIGGTSFEGLLFYPEVTRRPATLDEAKDCLNLLPADLELPPGDSDEAQRLAQQLRQSYFGDGECSRQTMMQFLELSSYREFWHPIYRTVRSRQLHADAPTFVYRFDYDSRDGNAIRNIICGRGVRGTCHGDDICYLFHSMLAHKSTPDSPEGRVIRTMVDVWTSFASNGDPNCESLKLNELKESKESSVDSKESPVNSSKLVCFEAVPQDPAAPLKALNIGERPEFVELPEWEKLRVWNSFYPASRL